MFKLNCRPSARGVLTTDTLITGMVESMRTGQPVRRFRDFHYATLDSWSRERRAVGKAEVTGGEANPRFVVTSLNSAEVGGQYLYQAFYFARGELDTIRGTHFNFDAGAHPTDSHSSESVGIRIRTRMSDFVH